MKKLFAILLAVVLVCSLSVTAFAKPGAFLGSPSVIPAPELVDYENGSHDCTAELIITPYSKRDTLSAEKKAAIESAYDQISDTADLSTFNADFKAAVEAKGLVAAQLAVSDLFDVSYYACELHNEHGAFTITIKAETLSNFVGLLHLNDGKWEYVSNAEVIENGKQLKFVVDDLSPFAIVVKNDKPQTGDAGINPIWFALMGVSAAGLVVVFVFSKKSKADEV